MKVALIITTPDFAGLNIKDNLIENYKFKKTDKSFEDKEIYTYANKLNTLNIYTTDIKCIYCENFDKEIDADLFLFPTTHRSEAGTNSLSCHVQGNWGKETLGGIPKDLSIAPANILKEIFKQLNSFNGQEEITLEVTHHGPELNKPTIFLEIGSDESQWKRPELGKFMAQVIINTFSKKIPEYKTALGVGGPHYCNNFNKIQLNNDIAIGHMCPKYNLQNLDKEMIIQAINKTTPKPHFIILDWKGLGKEKQRIKELSQEIADELKIEVLRTDKKWK